MSQTSTTEMTTAEANRALVRGAYEAFSRGDIPAAMLQHRDRSCTTSAALRRWPLNWSERQYERPLLATSDSCKLV